MTTNQPLSIPGVTASNIDGELLWGFWYPALRSFLACYGTPRDVGSSKNYVGVEVPDRVILGQHHI
jgi:hypothetical protein